MNTKTRVDAAEQSAKLKKVIDIVHHGMPRLIRLAPPRWMQSLLCRAGLEDRVKMYGLFLFQMNRGLFSGKLPPMLKLFLSRRDRLVPGRKQLIPTSGNAGKDLGILDTYCDSDGCVALVNQNTPAGKVAQLKAFGVEVEYAPDGIQATDYARVMAQDSMFELMDQYTDEKTVEGHEPTAEHIVREMDHLLEEGEVRDRGYTIATVTGTFSTAAAMARYAKWRYAADRQIRLMGICSESNKDKVPGSRAPEDIAELERIGGFFFRPEFKDALDFGGLVKGPALDILYHANASRVREDFIPLGPTSELCEIAYWMQLQKAIEGDSLEPFLNEAKEAVAVVLGMDSNHYYMTDERYAKAYVNWSVR